MVKSGEGKAPAPTNRSMVPTGGALLSLPKTARGISPRIHSGVCQSTQQADLCPHVTFYLKGTATVTPDREQCWNCWYLTRDARLDIMTSHVPGLEHLTEGIVKARTCF